MSDLYFAYGSNLLAAQMKMRCPNSTPYRKAILNDYKLVFPLQAGERWGGGGAAGIIRESGALVEGFLYRMTADDFKKLDVWEGVETRKYDRMALDVILDNGDSIMAQTYIANADDGGPYIPSAKYISTIIKGAQEHGLSGDYIEMLQKYLG